jgi:hypothetical protein
MHRTYGRTSALDPGFIAPAGSVDGAQHDLDALNACDSGERHDQKTIYPKSSERT